MLHAGSRVPVGQRAIAQPVAGRARPSTDCAVSPVPAAGAPGATPGDNDECFSAAFDDEGASPDDGDLFPPPYNADGGHVDRAPAAGRAAYRGAADPPVDDFCTAKPAAAGDYQRSSSVPHDVRRPDGLLVPLKPVDNVHATDFLSRSRDEHEARLW